MKKKFCKILAVTIAYVVLTTLFATPLFICSAQIKQSPPIQHPVFHPSYAMSIEYVGY
jgi:hypothetical protein